MSLSSRGQFSAPSSLPRDYGLLQAPRTTVHSFHGPDSKASQSETEEDEQAELDEARRAVDRYAHTGSVFDPHFAIPSPDGAERSAHRTGRTMARPLSSDHAPWARPSHDSSSIPPSATSRESSVERYGSGTSAGASPVAITGSQQTQHHPGGGSYSRRSSHLGAGTPGRSGTSRRYREMFLGGEPNPPPLEQVQQQYLSQHFPPGQHFVGSPPSAASFGAHRSNVSAPIRRSSSHSRLHSAPQRRWSRSSNEVVPRQADVAQVKNQLRRSSVVSADIERAPSQANERTPLVTGTSNGHDRASYASVPIAASAEANGSGLSARSERDTRPEPEESIASSDDESLVQAIPGPGAAREEATTLAWYTLPILGTHLLELSLSVVTVFAIGHLGTTQLAAASLASMTANVTGFSVISGWVSALDSLLPAAYSSPHPYTVGIWTQRMCVLIFFLTIPIVVVWLKTETLLLALRQDPAVSALAAQYLKILTLALPAFGAFEIIRRYLQALGLFHAPTIAVGFASAFNVPAQILLVYGPDKIRLGFLGAPVASLLSYYVMLVFGVFQCYLAPRDAWPGVSRKALEVKGLIEVWHLGLSSTIAMAAEWWAWEVANLMSSMLGTSALAAQSVLLVTCSLTYQLPQSVSVAAAVRIGNLLGANQPYWASLSSRTAMIGALICGVVNSSAMIIFRKQWGWMFSSDAELVQLIAAIMPYVGAFQIADGICGVGAGILRGSGRQSKGAVINLFAYYVVGLPIGGAMMTYGTWGLQGIWIGLWIGLTVGSAGFVALIFRTNWFTEAEKVLSRMEEDAIPEDLAEASVEDALEQEVHSLTEDDE